MFQNKIKRGHKVKFIKPFIEELTNRFVLIIEQGENGFVRDVLNDKIYVNIPKRNISVILKEEEISKYLKVSQ